MAVPVASVTAWPMKFPSRVNCIVFPLIGTLLCVSVSVAIRFTVSPLYPPMGFITSAVGVWATFSVVVLLTATKTLSWKKSASTVYVPLF